MMGYSPWGQRESDSGTIERACTDGIGWTLQGGFVLIRGFAHTGTHGGERRWSNGSKSGTPKAAGSGQEPGEGGRIISQSLQRTQSTLDFTQSVSVALSHTWFVVFCGQPEVSSSLTQSPPQHHHPPICPPSRIVPKPTSSSKKPPLSNFTPPPGCCFCK